MCDNDDVEGGSEAQKERPAEEAGGIIEAVGVYKNGTVRAGGGGGEVRRALELFIILAVFVLRADSSQELRRNGVWRVEIIDNGEAGPKKSGRNIREGSTFIIVETNENFHVVVRDDGFKQGWRKLEGTRGLWIERLIGEGDGLSIDAQENTAEGSTFLVQDINNPESKLLTQMHRKLADVEPSSGGGELMGEGWQEEPEVAFQFGHNPREWFEGSIGVDSRRVGDEIANFPGGKDGAARNSGPSEGRGGVRNTFEEDRGEREKVSAVRALPA